MDLNWLVTIVTFFAMLSVLVVIHEFGHFAVARFFKMRVDEFGLGFPPKIFGIKKGDTEYTLNWLPFGGFVRLRGEMPSDDGSAESDSFMQKPIWQRMLVVCAGVVMNVILTWALFTVLFAVTFSNWGQLTGKDIPYGAQIRNQKIEVLGVLKGSPAETLGVKEGDELTGINGRSFDLIDDYQAAIGQQGSNDYTIDLRRGEGERHITVHNEPLKVKNSITGKDEEKLGLGISFDHTQEVRLSLPFSALYAAKTTATGIVAILSALRNAVWNHSLSQFQGPVGLVKLTSEAVSFGWKTLLFLAAQLSLSLAVINILPIPALDGGRFLFLLIEKIRGKTMAVQAENLAQIIGFGFLLVLFVAVTFQDVWKLIFP